MNNIFYGNLERLTLENTDYRRVLYTNNGKEQLVVMSLKPGQEIGAETHKETDQFIRVEKGMAMAILENSSEESKELPNGKIEMSSFSKQEFTLNDGDAIMIPYGVKHNIKNIGTEDLKIYTIYNPPEHKPDTVQKEKPLEPHQDGGYYAKYMKYKNKYLKNKNIH